MAQLQLRVITAPALRKRLYQDMVETFDLFEDLKTTAVFKEFVGYLKSFAEGAITVKVIQGIFDSLEKIIKDQVSSLDCRALATAYLDEFCENRPVASPGILKSKWYKREVLRESFNSYSPDRPSVESLRKSRPVATALDNPTLFDHKPRHLQDGDSDVGHSVPSTSKTTASTGWGVGALVSGLRAKLGYGRESTPAISNRAAEISADELSSFSVKVQLPEDSLTDVDFPALTAPSPSASTMGKPQPLPVRKGRASGSQSKVSATTPTASTDNNLPRTEVQQRVLQQTPAALNPAMTLPSEEDDSPLSEGVGSADGDDFATFFQGFMQPSMGSGPNVSNTAPSTATAAVILSSDPLCQPNPVTSHGSSDQLPLALGSQNQGKDLLPLVPAATGGKGSLSSDDLGEKRNSPKPTVVQPVVVPSLGSGLNVSAAGLSNAVVATPSGGPLCQPNSVISHGSGGRLPSGLGSQNPDDDLSPPPASVATDQKGSVPTDDLEEKYNSPKPPVVQPIVVPSFQEPGLKKIWQDLVLTPLEQQMEKGQLRGFSIDNCSDPIEDNLILKTRNNSQIQVERARPSIKEEAMTTANVKVTIAGKQSESIVEKALIAAKMAVVAYFSNKSVRAVAKINATDLQVKAPLGREADQANNRFVDAFTKEAGRYIRYCQRLVRGAPSMFTFSAKVSSGAKSPATFSPSSSHSSPLSAYSASPPSQSSGSSPLSRFDSHSPAY